MTMPNSRSPELQEILRLAVSSRLRDVNVALPGKINSYDPSEQKADIKPLLKRITQTTDGNELEEELPVIPNVPVIFPRGGDFFISMPVKQGDFCLLIFNSFPVDKYKYGQGDDINPGDFSMHQLTDAVAIMGFSPFAQAIADADPDNIVIGVQDGNQVHIAEDKIELGKKGAADKASLDSKVQDELNAIRDSLDSLVTQYNAHIHTTTATIGASETTGVISPTTSSGTPPNPVGPTNSTLVTIDS